MIAEWKASIKPDQILTLTTIPRYTYHKDPNIHTLLHPSHLVTSTAINRAAHHPDTYLSHTPHSPASQDTRTSLHPLYPDIGIAADIDIDTGTGVNGPQGARSVRPSSAAALCGTKSKV